MMIQMMNKMVHIFFNKVLGENEKKFLSFLLEKCRRNAEYLAKLDRAFAQEKEGTMKVHELIEV